MLCHVHRCFDSCSYFSHMSAFTVETQAFITSGRRFMRCHKPEFHTVYLGLYMSCDLAKLSLTVLHYVCSTKPAWFQRKGIWKNSQNCAGVWHSVTRNCGISKHSLSFDKKNNNDIYDLNHCNLTAAGWCIYAPVNYHWSSVQPISSSILGYW